MLTPSERRELASLSPALKRKIKQASRRNARGPEDNDYKYIEKELSKVGKNIKNNMDHLYDVFRATPGVAGMDLKLVEDLFKKHQEYRDSLWEVRSFIEDLKKSSK